MRPKAARAEARDVFVTDPTNKEQSVAQAFDSGSCPWQKSGLEP